MKPTDLTNTQLQALLKVAGRKSHVIFSGGGKFDNAITDREADALTKKGLLVKGEQRRFSTSFHNNSANIVLRHTYILTPAGLDLASKVLETKEGHHGA